MSDETIHAIETINNRVKAIVERETLDDWLWASGEIRGLYQSDRGHVYFYLQDDNYSIHCIFRENHRANIDFTPQNTMEVEVYGTIQVYAERAIAQIEVDKMRLVKGQLMSDFVTVEEQLRKRGKYPNEKKPLPTQIKKIALITSKSSEAYFDFFNTYVANEGKARVELIDVRVQGEFAPKQIADAINRINHEKSHDVIVITRGGGRRSDMTIYDDILIAEAIVDCEIPVITAIGHERDDFFADRVADIKRNTPTDVAVFLAQQQAQAMSQNLFLLIGLGVIVVIIIIIAIVAFGG